MAGLSKSRIIQHRQCPKRLWLYVNHPELIEEDPSVTARFAAGHNVGEIARGLYPQGLLIEAEDVKQALADTAQALAAKRVPLFEAAFSHNKVFVRADLLLPVRGGYRLVEVKSSTRVHDYHLEDTAIQSWVARQAGVPVKRVEVAHLNNTFRYPGNGDYEDLFTYADVTDTVMPMGKEVPGWISSAQQTLAGGEPAIEPGEQCANPFPCPFSATCNPASDDNGYPPEILPNGNGKALAAKLRKAGYTDLRKVPIRMVGHDKLKRVVKATKTGKAILEAGAAESLASLPYPRFYLDFETMWFPVPIWQGTRPYQQIPFQWSCHVEHKDGALTHNSFLAGDADDPRRDFAVGLIKTVKGAGPVLVYNAGFESTRLRELAADFPDLAPALSAIRDRIVDLLPIARQHYYHRDMHGSWSIKAVLPTIAPELSYDGLDVADGGMAMEAFARILDPATPEAIVRKLRQDLLIYCERDTLAMVRIAHYFQGMAG